MTDIEKRERLCSLLLEVAQLARDISITDFQLFRLTGNAIRSITGGRNQSKLRIVR